MDGIFKEYGYDKEYFLEVEKDKRISVCKKTINDLVQRVHDPSLIKPNILSSNIYRLYSDGVITTQKVHGDRTMINLSHECIKPNTFFSFPMKGHNTGDTYAIMTERQCIIVREMIKDMILKC